MLYLGFHHIALDVSDIERSVEFYTKGLGLKMLRSWGEGEGRAVMLEMADGGIFELFAGGGKGAEKNAHFLHFAFSADDVDAAYIAALDAGASSHMEPASLTIKSDPELPVRIAFVKGPDEELIEFFKCV